MKQHGILAALAAAIQFGASTPFAKLYAFRDGDSNMRSVWICSRNDAVGNMAVLGAASGVFATGSGWPELVVAGIMAVVALSGAPQVLRHAFADAPPIGSGRA